VSFVPLPLFCCSLRALSGCVLRGQEMARSRCGGGCGGGRGRVVCGCVRRCPSLAARETEGEEEEEGAKREHSTQQPDPTRKRPAPATRINTPITRQHEQQRASLPNHSRPHRKINPTRRRRKEAEHPVDKASCKTLPSLPSPLPLPFRFDPGRARLSVYSCNGPARTAVRRDQAPCARASLREREEDQQCRHTSKSRHTRL
jgi:hypothetical protein